MNLNKLTNRDALPFVLMEHGLTSLVEIGCYRGEFAAHICTHSTVNVTTVDPWIDYPKEEYLDGCAATEPMEWHMRAALETLKPWLISGQCKVLRMTSLEAAEKFEDESVDCVYLDGNHSIQHVRQDVELWWPKIRSGGILGLHDTYQRNDEYQVCGVWPVVWSFGHEINQMPRLTPCTSAWFVKP